MKTLVRDSLFLALIAAALSVGGVAPPDSVAQSSRAPEPTPAALRMASFEKVRRAMAESPFRNAPFRSVGPSIMGGRVVDVEVSPDDPTVFYVAYATGGLWMTESNGSAFTPLFEHQPTAGIGDVAVRWGDPDVIYVGTGESNASSSVVAGAGVYRSRDAGSSWQYLGLAETHNIGKVLLSPVDTSVVFVAAVGHLYSNNPERGVYKSTDGGETWKATLQVDDSTGVVDLIMHPDDHETLLAATWHRRRKAWDFVEGGRTSAVYKSTDNGETWSLLSTKKSGFPTGRHVGRIGLAIAPSLPSTMYAVIDNQKRVDDESDLPALGFEHLMEMDREFFLERVTDEELDEYLDHYDFPSEYDAQAVRRLVETKQAVPAELAEWVGESNRLVFDTDVIGCEVYRSNDGGVHWWRTNEKRLEDVCKSYGHYFGRIVVDPRDPDLVYLSGVPLLRSKDGGETFENIGKENVHVDHHALWISPTRPGHLLDGNDGGLNLSYDGGDTWFKLNVPPVGQFYTVNVDFADPYNIYGGLQDNGVWYGPSTYEASPAWQVEGAYPYRHLLGGDGMMAAVPASDDNVVFAGKQFGEYYRITKDPAETVHIKPYHRLGEERLRFNWKTPIHISAHNDRILYLGSQKVHRSMDDGESWQVLSDDLSGGEREGDVPFGTLTSLIESPLRFGVIYAGSDDGLIHLSKDGGVSWREISHPLPQKRWVAGIEPSRHEPGRVYVALNGARWDNFEALVFVSDDFGQSWERVGLDLPLEAVNVIREDPVNPCVLYVGTDRGLYVSVDRGATFYPVGVALPSVPVHDIRIHPRDLDLVVATHGRSVFIGDASKFQKFDDGIVASPIFAFEVDTVRHDPEWGNSDHAWESPEEPRVEFVFWASKRGRARFSIVDREGDRLVAFERAAERGLNYVYDDLSVCEDYLEKRLHAQKKRGVATAERFMRRRENGKSYVPPGSFEVIIELNGGVAKTPLFVKE